jgi:hypothetical protein
MADAEPAAELASEEQEPMPEDAAAPADGAGAADESSHVVVATVIRPLLPHELAGARSRCTVGASSSKQQPRGRARLRAHAAAPPPAEGASECVFATPGEPQARARVGAAAYALRRRFAPTSRTRCADLRAPRASRLLR